MTRKIVQPQIIGFGAQKAGTTWLFDNLSTNPAIWRPPLKEMHFFNHVATGSRWMFQNHRMKLIESEARLREKGKLGKADQIKHLLTLPMLTEEWYREAYRPCPDGKMSMDITPAYATLGQDSIRYMIHLLGGDFKSIFLIRDPASRVISAIKRDAARNGSVTESIEYWLEQACRSDVRLRSDYRATISRLDDLLGDRVLYLPFGMIKSDPAGLLRQVEEHCGLPQGEYIQANRPSHVSPLVALPGGLQEALRILLRDQYRWLESRFTGTFVSQV